MVGSEGTLGFVAEAVFRTVPRADRTRRPACWSSPTCSAATAALPALVEAGAGDHRADGRAVAAGRPAATRRPARDPRPRGRPARRAAGGVPGRDRRGAGRAAAPRSSRLLGGAAGLAARSQLTARRRRRGPRCGTSARASTPPSPAPGRRGTTALLEDVVVPVPALLRPARDLTGLFDRHGYEDSVIFGHAKDGNVHFMLNERLRRRAGRSTATARSPTTWWTSSSARAARSRPSTAPAGSWRRSCAGSTATSCTR